MSTDSIDRAFKLTSFGLKPMKLTMKILSFLAFVFLLFPRSGWAWGPFTLENQESTPQKVKVECLAPPATLTLTPQQVETIKPANVPCRLSLDSLKPSTYLAMPEQAVAVKEGRLVNVTKPLGSLKITNKDSSSYNMELACFGQTQQMPVGAQKEITFNVYKKGVCTLSILKTPEKLKIPQAPVSSVTISNGKLTQ